MRTTRTSPLKLWVPGQMNNAIGMQFTEEFLQFYGVEGRVDEVSDCRDESQRPIFNAPKILSQDCITILNATVDPN